MQNTIDLNANIVRIVNDSIQLAGYVTRDELKAALITAFGGIQNAIADLGNATRTPSNHTSRGPALASTSGKRTRRTTTTTKKSIVEVLRDHGGSMLSSAARKESRLAKPRFEREVRSLLASGAVVRQGSRGAAKIVLQSNGASAAVN